MAARLSQGAKCIMMLSILSAVIMVSGCTTNGDGVSFGKGVAIRAFESDLQGQVLESDDQVSLLLRVQNQGELDAEEVEALIYNIDLDEWGAGFSFQGDTQRLGTLLAADPVTNTEGATKTVQWDLEAPDLPEGTRRTYTPKVRVSYDYITRAVKPISIVDVDELRKIIQRGGTIPSDITRTSAGPFRVEIRTGDFIKTQDLDPVFNLNIFITNDLWESGGSVTQDSGFFGGFGFEEYQYPLRVEITLPDSMSLTGFNDDCSTSGEVVNLWKGKSKEITCEVRIDDPPEIMQEETIEVELEYRFEMDDQTTVDVVGTEEGFRF